MKAVIEVGANTGQNTLELYELYPESTIFTFEPSHELLQNYLWPKFSDKERIMVLPFAVDTQNGIRQFNIAGHYDWGCSSFYNFAEDIENKWPNRPDFKTTHRYNVPTITLFDFCNLYNITEIEYLWVDAQGHDFLCLQSLGEKISIVQKGKCEAALNVELYSNANNASETIQAWLEDLEFNTEIVPDQSGISAECDVHFWR